MAGAQAQISYDLSDINIIILGCFNVNDRIRISVPVAGATLLYSQQKWVATGFVCRSAYLLQGRGGTRNFRGPTERGL